MDLLRCVRCGHEWYQRTPERPLRCANRNCSRPNWWRPARVRKERYVGSVGAPIQYPFHNLEPGQSVLIKWPVGINADTTRLDGGRDYKKIISLNSCISSHARRTGKKFIKEGKPAGLLVTRLS